MNVTSVLGEAVGIQWQGVKDNSEATIYTGLNRALLLGRFRRGRSDKPMEITLANIKAKLGYDPTNPDYIAVQGILDKNIPRVYVLNLGRKAGV